MKGLLCSVLFSFSFYVGASDYVRLSDIRSMGMGENGVTQSVCFNPALVALNNQKILHLDYLNRYGLKELGTLGLGFVCPNALLPIGIHISSFGYDAYRETLFRFSAGKRLNERWIVGIGVQYRMLQTELFEEVPKQMTTDVGILFSPVDKVLIGMLVMDFPSFSSDNVAVDYESLASYFVQIGFQWHIINNLLMAGSLETTKTYTLGGNIGIEYTAFDNFHIRAGLQTAPLLPTLGIGYGFTRFSVDVVAFYHPVLGISSGCGLRYSF